MGKPTKAEQFSAELEKLVDKHSDKLPMHQIIGLMETWKMSMFQMAWEEH